MKEIAFVIGIVAVCLYLLGYLQKRRKSIIILNLSSRILYIIQYILLGAFEGAALDVCGSASSVLAEKKDTEIIKKHFYIFFIGVNIAITTIGLSLYVNVFSLFPIMGVLLHTSAFWIDDEKRIRLISLLGCPFWLVYNISSGAYGSCIGDVLSMVSIIVSMMRYDIMPKFKSRKENQV